MPYLHFFSNIRCNVCKHNASFSLLHAANLRKHEPNRSISNRPWIDIRDDFRGLFCCGHCQSPLTIDFRARSHEHVNDLLGYLNRLTNHLINPTSNGNVGYMTIEARNLGQDLHNQFDISSFYPNTKKEIPTNLPEEIHSLYVEDLLHAEGSARLTVITCRLILESACRDKLGTDKGQLINLIKQLGDKEMLPKVMLDWAHTIRQFGNEAVHDPAPQIPAEAADIRSFTEALLDFLYTYPAKIEAIRKETAH